MVDKKVRVAKAREFFLKGYNCSQSVFCAFSDMYSIPEDLSLKLSASFGGGIGRMRETCGAACGMFMLAGLESGQLDANDNLAKQKSPLNKGLFDTLNYSPLVWCFSINI